MKAYLPLLIFALAAPTWTLYGETCGPMDAMQCTAGALLSGSYSGAITVDADVAVTPAADGRFWAGLALNGAVAADNLYVQASVENNILPYVEGIAPTGGPAGVMLADGADHCCRIFGSADPSTLHHLRVSYDGKQRATACVDGVCETVKIALPSYRVELLCVGVDPGESGVNSVGCAFSGVAIRAKRA